MLTGENGAFQGIPDAQDSLAAANSVDFILFTQDYPTRFGATFTQGGLGAAGAGIGICPSTHISSAPVLTTAQWGAWNLGTRTEPALPATTASIFGERVSATTATNAVAVTGYAFKLSWTAYASFPLIAPDCYFHVETPGQGFGYPGMENPVGTVITPIMLDENDFSLGIQTGNATLDAFSAGVPYQVNMLGVGGSNGIGLVVGLFYKN